MQIFLHSKAPQWIVHFFLLREQGNTKPSVRKTNLNLQEAVFFFLCLVFVFFCLEPVTSPAIWHLFSLETCFESQMNPYKDRQHTTSLYLSITSGIFFFFKCGPVCFLHSVEKHWYGNVWDWKLRHMAICNCNALFSSSLGPSPCLHESSRSNWNGRAHLRKMWNLFYQGEPWTCLIPFSVTPATICSP